MTSDCSCGRQARFANAPIKVAICWAFAATLTACDAGPSAQPDPQKLAAALTGEDKLAADKSPQCKLFKPAELAKFVGLPVGPGRVAAMGSGCQWPADGNDDGSVLIQVVAARYHEPHSGAPEFKKLPDIGHRGFVEHDILDLANPMAAWIEDARADYFGCADGVGVAGCCRHGALLFCVSVMAS